MSLVLVKIILLKTYSCSLVIRITFFSIFGSSSKLLLTTTQHYSMIFFNSVSSNFTTISLKAPFLGVFFSVPHFVIKCPKYIFQYNKNPMFLLCTFLIFQSKSMKNFKFPDRKSDCFILHTVPKNLTLVSFATLCVQHFMSYSFFVSF